MRRRRDRRGDRAAVPALPSILLACLLAAAVVFSSVLLLNLVTAQERASSPSTASTTEFSSPISDLGANGIPDEERQQADGNEQGEASALPLGWLIAEQDGIPAFSKVDITSAPSLGISSPDSAKEPSQDVEGECIVRYREREVAVSTDLVLVNLPDVLEKARYDISYSYSAPSASAGREIPGLTGCVVDGYAEKSENPRLGHIEHAVPFAMRSAEKLKRAEDTLCAQGYSILVWDAYRPYRASQHISQAFESAYECDPAIRQAVIGWSLSWYAADGPSGHNFATDIDLTLCDFQGNIMDMPSRFDAFDESAHLVDSPMSASSITPEKYTAAVKANKACIALHEAMTSSGFGELASEWWHFTDDTQKETVESVVGPGGMDFIATNS